MFRRITLTKESVCPNESCNNTNKLAVGSACPGCGTTIRQLGFMEGSRLSRAKRQSKDRPKPQSTSSGKHVGSESMIAIFSANQYLRDPRCQKLMLELSHTWKGMNPASAALIAEFHPLSEPVVQDRSPRDGV